MISLHSFPLLFYLWEKTFKHLIKLISNYATVSSGELRHQQGVPRGKWRETSKYGCTGKKAAGMWSSTLRSRVNRQQGRAMGGTDSAAVREGQAGGEGDMTIVFVKVWAENMTCDAFNSFVNLLTDHMQTCTCSTSRILISLSRTVVANCQSSYRLSVLTVCHHWQIV